MKGVTLLLKPKYYSVKSKEFGKKSFWASLSFLEYVSPLIREAASVLRAIGGQSQILSHMGVSPRGSLTPFDSLPNHTSQGVEMGVGHNQPR